LYISTLFYLLHAGLQLDLSIFSEIPHNTVRSGYIHTLFTSSFVHEAWLTLIVAILLYTPEGARTEKESGTILKALDFIYLNLQIQVLFIAASYVLFYVLESTIYMSSRTLFPIFLASLTTRCMRTPDKKVFVMCIPVEVKARLLPLIQLGILTLVSWDGVRIDLFIAVLVGYFHHELGWTRLSISRDTIVAVENVGIIKKYISSQKSFIAIDASDMMALNGKMGMKEIPKKAAANGSGAPEVIEVGAGPSALDKSGTFNKSINPFTDEHIRGPPRGNAVPSEDDELQGREEFQGGNGKNPFDNYAESVANA
jgi:hypothetical protein